MEQAREMLSGFLVFKSQTFYRFKDDVILDISSGKYFVENNAGFHALTILK